MGFLSVGATPPSRKASQTNEIGVRSQLILVVLATRDIAAVLGVPTLSEANIANTCAAIEKFMAWAGGGVEQLSVTQN
jgi:hypothetical protein